MNDQVFNLLDYRDNFVKKLKKVNIPYLKDDTYAIRTDKLIIMGHLF